MKNNNQKTITKDITLPNEIVKEILSKNYYQKSMETVENSDVDINHLENIFTNEIYYTAMKMLPLVERKILYLSYIETTRLNDICRKLKLERKQVIYLRTKAINTFKRNLDVLYKAQYCKKGNKN